jgi:hypothetical protein
MSASTNLLLTLLLRLTAGPAATTSASTNLLLTFLHGGNLVSGPPNLLLSLLLLLGGSLGLSGGLSSGPSGSNCLS